MRNILRILAPCVVVIALLTLNRTKHENVLIVLLEGAAIEDVRALSATGRAPTLSAALAAGIGGDISVSRTIDGMDGVVSALVGDTVDGGAPRLWPDLARRSRRYLLIGVPGTQSQDERGAVVLAGPDAEHGFIGSNLGIVVNRKSLEKSPLPWPYALATARIKKAVAELAADGASEWMELETGAGSRRGILRVYGLDEDAVYLTPIYTRYVGGAGRDAEPYVADEPSVVSVSSRAGDYLARHVSDLADARVAFASGTLAAGAVDLLVYVDRSLVITRAGHTGRLGAGAVSAETRLEGEDGYAEVDRRLAELTDLAGPRAVVLVVGVAPSSSVNGTVGWFAMPAPGAASDWLRVDVDELAATIRYLLALPTNGSRSPISAIAAAYPTRGAHGTSPVIADSRAVVPLSTASLRELAVSVGDTERGAVTATSTR